MIIFLGVIVTNRDFRPDATFKNPIVLIFVKSFLNGYALRIEILHIGPSSFFTLVV